MSPCNWHDTEEHKKASWEYIAQDHQVWQEYKQHENASKNFIFCKPQSKLWVQNWQRIPFQTLGWAYEEYYKLFVLALIHYIKTTQSHAKFIQHMCRTIYISGQQCSMADRKEGKANTHTISTQANSWHQIHNCVCTVSIKHCRSNQYQTLLFESEPNPIPHPK
jgi:hypothetical protein